MALDGNKQELPHYPLCLPPQPVIAANYTADSRLGYNREGETIRRFSEMDITCRTPEILTPDGLVPFQGFRQIYTMRRSVNNDEWMDGTTVHPSELLPSDPVSLLASTVHVITSQKRSSHEG